MHSPALSIQRQQVKKPFVVTDPHDRILPGMYKLILQHQGKVYMQPSSCDGSAFLP